MSPLTILADERRMLADAAASPAREIHLAGHLVIEHALGISPPFLAVAKVREYGCFASTFSRTDA